MAGLGLPIPVRIPTIIQMITASISVVASSTIMIMVGLVATGGLSKSPYRRLIFGLSLADLYQSAVLAIGPLAVPRDVPFAPWARGSTFTCDAAGFFLLSGNIGVPLYTFGICLYYLCRTKYRMTNQQFAQRFEIKLHMFIVLFSLSTSFAGLVTKNFAVVPTRSFCYIASYPSFCRDKAEFVGECTRGLQAPLYFFIVTYANPGVCIIGITTSMILICCHARYQQRVIDTFCQPTTDALAPEFSPGKYNRLLQCFGLFQERQSQESDAQYLSRYFVSENVLRATLFVSSYTTTYCLTWVYTAFYWAGNIPHPVFFYVLPVFYPLGGLFNILIHTRPALKSFRRKKPTLNWFEAFWLVLKAGGEVPFVETFTRSSESHDTKTPFFGCCKRSPPEESSVEVHEDDYKDSTDVVEVSSSLVVSSTGAHKCESRMELSVIQEEPSDVDLSLSLMSSFPQSLASIEDDPGAGYYATGRQIANNMKLP